MNEWAINIFDSLEKIGIATPIVVMLLAALPIAEARIALPLGIKYGMSTAAATFYSFLGSSAAALLLCACFLPIMNKLSQSKVFGKLSQRILNVFKIKSQKINYDKAALSLCAFVAVPLPLTGVWTGSAIASVLGLSYIRSVASVIAGNLIACIIIAFISTLLSEYINIILWAFAALAITSVIVAILKNFKKAT